MLLASNQSLTITDSSTAPDGTLMGPNHKKCEQCGIVMLKKNFARHMRDMHTEPQASVPLPPLSICPFVQMSIGPSAPTALLSHCPSVSMSLSLCISASRPHVMPLSQVTCRLATLGHIRW